MKQAATTLLFALSIFACISAVPCDEARAKSDAEPTLRILNWSRYIDIDTETDPALPVALRSPTLRAFMDKHHCEVIYDEYDTEVEMAKKINNLPGFFDIVLATRSTAAKMEEAGLLAPLDERAVPNLKRVIPKYLPKTEPRRPCSFAPYLVGTTGLVYREDIVGKEVKSWKDYFHPPEHLKGKIGTMDTSFMMCFGLLAQNVSPNSRNRSHIRKAAELFLNLKRNGFLTLFTSDYDILKNRLVSGESAMAIMYSGDALSVAREGENIKYTIPIEGGEYYVDGMMLLKDAPNKKLGNAFINYILDPEVNARLAVHLNYACSVQGAREFIRKLDPAQLDNPGISIPPEVMDRLYIFTDNDANEIRRLWRKIIK